MPYDGPNTVADMEQMLQSITLPGGFVPVPQAVLSIMERSFQTIKDILQSGHNNGSFGDRRSPAVVEDSLSLIIDDLALGRHSL